MKRFLSTAVAVASLALLSGCPKPPDVKPEPPPETTTNTGVDTTGATAEDADAAGPSAGLLASRIVYFDFDRSDIRADSQQVVQAHAQYLSKNPSQKVRLEGHADERGSREYNIGLGERRSQAVRRAMLLQGVAEAQITTVSYGEERPAAAGSDEQSYAQNRRVEIVYVK